MGPGVYFYDFDSRFTILYLEKVLIWSQFQPVMICKHYRGPDIAEFANIADFFENYISNYLLSVMNDVIFTIDFLKSSLFNFYLIAFGGVFHSTH
jgi:pantothenate kinase